MGKRQQERTNDRMGGWVDREEKEEKRRDVPAVHLFVDADKFGLVGLELELAHADEVLCVCVCVCVERVGG